jgi:hypothetical protein
MQAEVWLANPLYRRYGNKSKATNRKKETKLLQKDTVIYTLAQVSHISPHP